MTKSVDRELFVGLQGVTLYPETWAPGQWKESKVGVLNFKKPECVNCRGNIRYLGCTTYFKLHLRRTRLCALLTRVILFRVRLFILLTRSWLAAPNVHPRLQKSQSSQDRNKRRAYVFIKHWTDRDTNSQHQQQQVRMQGSNESSKTLNLKP